ncbi:TonB-dependent receptor [Flavobacterium akiainvivens]|uniref:TonB-dependent receptor n=1 Tax=Flavobacterium akiainvivens TaxID=1202724 RepID=A0A0M8MF40_9FLAO|nr:TonB-dependent receptor [Flavobacterium akiainvivens]KOS04941.1 TonB-dependent receptor [Flavobacterium akiainvivens]SFQ41743.1 Outer membrane receptor proteins, mostly Fe transport [Flavobacterium akiainvivens]
MKFLKITFIYSLLFLSAGLFAQGQPAGKKVTVTGTVTDASSKEPLEFANIVIQNVAGATMGGGLTDDKGKFSVEVAPGTYKILISFFSYKNFTIENRAIEADTNLGAIGMSVDATELEGVEIISEVTTVELKLDKRVYNIGNDMMVKGGTVSDVLDNVPSLSVDAEGNVALRGNQSVTILIDGRPSNLAGSNVAEVLRLLPADSVDKVEIITNPSARYDAEGGGGIVNIVLKKGKANGFNGSLMANTGDPANHGASANLNFRGESFNLYTNMGYNYRNNPGNSKTEAEYLDADNNTESFTNERRTNDRKRKGFNATVGLEWFVDSTATWTNAISIRRNTGDNPTKTYYDNYDASRNYLSSRYRLNAQESEESNLNYSTSFQKKFDNNGHELKIDMSASKNIEDENANISDEYINTNLENAYQRTFNDTEESRGLIQADYVLPLGESGRFEAGYRGSFSQQDVDFTTEDLVDGAYENNVNYTNHLIYKEKVNALYAQYGNKMGKFSYLLGLRWEDSNIDVNLLTTNDFNNKRYNNFFPTAFASYEFSESSSLSLSYARRINRPRGRFLNPFGGLESNINIFRGNPDINPSMTHSIDAGYMKKWRDITLNTSAYFNMTDDSFQFVRQAGGTTADGTPITLTTPINLAKEYRFGFEFNVNYNPFKWWRLNSNFNFFRNETQGDYTFTYTDPTTGETVNDYQDFNNTAYAWTTRLNSKISLPWKIDWQLNGNYEAPQNNAQGRRVGVASANTALSKDILKDQATIALNVQDIFNSRKMKNDTFIPGQIRSYSEMQWRQRQVTLSFTYRFNMSRSDRQKEQQRQRQDNGGGGDEYMGG